VELVCHESAMPKSFALQLPSVLEFLAPSLFNAYTSILLTLLFFTSCLQEKAIQEQIRKAEQLVASLGGASVGAGVDSEFLSPPPGFESWAANRGGPPPRHRNMAGGRRQYEGERQLPDNRGARRGADYRRGGREDKGAVPCVLWLGYPPNGAVKGDTELREICNVAAGGEGHVVSMATKPSFTKGNPCQYIEMSCPAAATAALEQLRRVLPKVIHVQYRSVSLCL
jgi:hypothetical protein